MTRFTLKPLPAVRSGRSRALVEFSKVHEYSWHTPGHTGGTAFLKSPAGRVFHHFFGENLFAELSRNLA